MLSLVYCQVQYVHDECVDIMLDNVQEIRLENLQTLSGNIFYLILLLYRTHATHTYIHIYTHTNVGLRKVLQNIRYKHALCSKA